MLKTDNMSITTLQTIKEQVEQKLQDQQKNRTFKDIGRVAQTRKEKSAYKLISGQILSTLEDDAVMAFNMVKKENVWPEINVEEERNKGTTAGATYLKVKIREAAPTRPKDEKAKRATYVLFLEKLQLDLLECYDVAQIKALTERYRNLSMDQVIGYFLNPEFLTASEERKKEIESALKAGSSSKLRVAFMYGGGVLVAKLINEVFGSRFENTLLKKSDAARLLWADAEHKEPITAEESASLISALLERKTKFIEANEALIEKYRQMDSSSLLPVMNRDWSLGKEIQQVFRADREKFREFAISYYQRRIARENSVWDEKEKQLQPRDNDWSWAEKKAPNTTTSAKPKAQTINTKEPLSYIKRTGGYKIEVNTPSEIIDKFGFSAVNYGVYVDDAWSKEHTKHFLGAMSDLGQTLNINIAQFNQLGRLSIAFGAKGRKGHSAAYFPQTKDINLTRGNGDGSVAHEWGHYFDNVIVEGAQQIATNKFASDNASPDYEIKLLFKELMDFYYRGNPLYTPKIPMRFYAQKRDEAPTYYNPNGSGKVEIKSTIEETLEQLKGISIVDQSIYTTQKRVFGWIIDQFGLEDFDVPMTLKTSYVYHKSAYNIFQYCVKTEKGIAIGADPRTKYWTSAPELFARAWETVVLKKILAQNRISNYLVNDLPMTDIVSENYFAPYPAGAELDYIENILDRIILAVKKRYSIGDFVPPSAIIEDEYLDLTKTGKVEAGMEVEKNLVTGEETVDFVGAIATLEMLLESDPENAEWKEAIETLKMLTEK